MNKETKKKLMLSVCYAATIAFGGLFITLTSDIPQNFGVTVILTSFLGGTLMFGIGAVANIFEGKKQDE